MSKRIKDYALNKDKETNKKNIDLKFLDFLKNPEEEKLKEDLIPRLSILSKLH